MPEPTRREGALVTLRVPEEERPRYAGCFACGSENPQGLKLQFRAAGDDGVWAVFRPQEHHQGWPSVVHGGLVATLLDEAAAYVAVARGERAATVRLNLRFQQPAPLDADLRVEARLTRATRRLLEVHGAVTAAGGKTIAEADATLLLLTGTQKRTFGLTDDAKEGK